ncbi:hypothetical protein [Streptomyces sp. AcH 505]|uniref:hypothetical protein n=1 Tax=Streptomyces sp. AcH 505 TaxID=352211 RepID=UPI0012FE9446
MSVKVPQPQGTFCAAAGAAEELRELAYLIRKFTLDFDDKNFVQRYHRTASGARLTGSRSHCAATSSQSVAEVS